MREAPLPSLGSRLVVSLALIVTGVGMGPLPRARAQPNSAVWVSRYSGPRGDVAKAVTVSPDGARVFVTGNSTGPSLMYDFATAAYDAVTGASLWSRRYNGPGNADDLAFAITSSPDGSRVFVTGSSGGAGTKTDYATVAYDSATGTTLWVRRYDGPNNARDSAYGIAVAPDGSRVFVTGSSCECNIAEGDFATVAYGAATGAQLWIRRYDAGLGDTAYALAVSPDGTRVFVTGTSMGGAIVIVEDYATVAYDSTTGTPLWVSRYDGPDHDYDVARSLAVSPDGTLLFVTGQSDGVEARADYATVAYEAATGRGRWIRRYDGPGHDEDVAYSVAVSADGSRVFVTGGSPGSQTDDDSATVAYVTDTGVPLWVSRYNGSGNGEDSSYSVAGGPDGSRVYVTGASRSSNHDFDYLTIAYDQISGDEVRVDLYPGPGGGDDAARWLSVSPDGSSIFVTGSSVGSVTGIDYATVAYEA